MTIRYSNGQAVEAVLLSRTATSMRIVPEGHDDAVELTLINGTWVSDDCEAVQVEFAWTQRVASTDVTEEECICAPELAERLINALYGGEREPRIGASAAVLWIGSDEAGSGSDRAISLI